MKPLDWNDRGLRLSALGIDPQRPETLPFVGGDATVGTETELQAAVLGRAEAVDLPRSIEHSSYFANVARRAATGETPGRSIEVLEDYLGAEGVRVWENSWVRFPLEQLGQEARRTLEADLQQDKERPGGGLRRDSGRFLFQEKGEDRLRVPISYLVKLALADAVDEGAGGPGAPLPIRATARRLMERFSNDNTSPETVSFRVLELHPRSGGGLAPAREAAKRFLLTDLLVRYANRAFGLLEAGQEATIFFCPHPPVRQQALNGAVSDSFYRELFMSPCLSGWRRGEEKKEYMALCHQTLSRSQLNAVAKLREAGILPRDLVVLPDHSNVSLAANGCHVSFGSRRLTALRGAGDGAFPARQEKALGDLVIKIAEHFLPLFVGTYSAAPYRVDFASFHPERVLGFLPHELDFTHLRMLWRQWRSKADLQIFGRPTTPFGIASLDRALSAVLGMRGDYLPDVRLIDFPVAFKSTERSPALDGRSGNQDRLRGDLHSLGVTDASMSLYLAIKNREQRVSGFTGFEARYTSLFGSFRDDLGRSIDLQHLILALAVRLAAEGAVSHGDLPDDPSTESERRQAFFAGALGLPAIFVHEKTGNRFLRGLLSRCRRLRSSQRHRGYLRVGLADYRRALVSYLRETSGDLQEALGLGDLLTDLEDRLRSGTGRGTLERLQEGILEEAGAHCPLAADAATFNSAAEAFYRTALKRRQLTEALDLLDEELAETDWRGELTAAAGEICGSAEPRRLLAGLRDALLEPAPSAQRLRQAIRLLLLTEATPQGGAASTTKTREEWQSTTTWSGAQAPY